MSGLSYTTREKIKKTGERIFRKRTTRLPVHGIPVPLERNDKNAIAVAQWEKPGRGSSRRPVEASGGSSGCTSDSATVRGECTRSTTTTLSLKKSIAAECSIGRQRGRECSFVSSLFDVCEPIPGPRINFDAFHSFLRFKRLIKLI